MLELPGFLEYFYYDILGGDNCINFKKMFGGYGIFKQNKIFAIFIDDELYFRINPLVKNNYQYYYLRGGKKVLLPYFYVDESIIEDSEKLHKYIKASLNY